MGIYINPIDGTPKEQWLIRNGSAITQEQFLQLPNDHLVGICIVDNGPFTAAAVAYSRQEGEYFTSSKDERPKRFFAVEKHLLGPEVDIDIETALRYFR
jgi:hypothetical protein